MRAAAAVTVLVAGWLLAPWVAMWRRGTLDEQTVRSWQEG